MIKLFKSVQSFVKDPEKDFPERIFLILTFVSEVMVLCALIGDLIMGENIYEIAIIIGELILVPIIVLISLRIDKLSIAIRIIVIGLVFGVLPGLFFFGGGLEGGGFLWIIFGFMYVGLVLRDRWRIVMLTLTAIMAVGCYILSYLYPEWVYPHSRVMFYVDSAISLLIVGVMSYIMTWSQNRLFMKENERARKEAERAEELTRSQNRFFSSMSHEIRTPINSILGLNELILRDQSTSDDVARDATGIQGAGKMLLALINDILDFSKIEAGSMDIVPVDYRVGDLLSEIVNMMWLRAQDKGLGFEVSVDPEVPQILYGDEVRIKQVIINLLNNAVKYTKEGHVELHVESKPAEDDIIELWISISDSGQGIKKEDLPFLFDAFKRVDEGKNRHIEGTGLGLSIVKQLVELMDGTITVSSVYGEGSTFTVMIRQKVTDPSYVGELNIHNQQIIKRSSYESSFLAPEAKILIVDDNEMNLEVERRLLIDTDMTIDVAKSGKEALELSQKSHYDTIFMDHLMPGMDGIECLENLRRQTGGLNRHTPVVVLTANAGSENRELYNQAGFDGYLVKPVSGEAMEETLIRHISKEKIILRSVLMGMDEEINTTDKFSEKLPVLISASSMCDLPDPVIRKLNIPIIPFVIRTDEGVFKDGIHMDANELIRHINSGKEATSAPQDEAAYTEFFSENLKRAHHLIHISLTTSMSKEYQISSEAAKSFDNVTIINSECLSSSTGILVLIGYKLIQQGLTVPEIVSELEMMKQRLKCSFVLDTTSYLADKGLISKQLHRFAAAVSLHPALRFKNDKVGIGGLWFGRTKRAYRKYISRTIPADTIPDSDVVFITYADVPQETLNWIEESIRKVAYFEHVIFQQASAAISSNCGPGTIGILYFLKSNKSYNIGSFLEETVRTEEADVPEEDVWEEEQEETEEEPEETEGWAVPEEAEPEAPAEEKWYHKLDQIDGEAAIKNSGSEDAFQSVLKIFYESIPDRSTELEEFYSSENWESYTIKIHALKSSAKLVGALGLSKQAELLEKAGKENDIAYIKEHHTNAMEDYLKFQEILSPLYAAEEDSDKPVADEYLMEGIYEGLKEAAEEMDCDMVEEILKEIDGYAIPANEKEKFGLVREKADMLDYMGMLEVLKE